MTFNSIAVFVAIVAVASAQSNRKLLTSFESGAKTTHMWRETNDPVMGGRSFGNFTVESEVGVFQGSVLIVPSLKAPGFCNAKTSGVFITDASEFMQGGVVLNVRTSTPNFEGYQFEISAIGASHHTGGHEIGGSYKTNFTVAKTAVWEQIYLPFDTFSSDWSDYTGRCETKDPTGYQHKCCKDDVTVCPNTKTLKAIDGFGIWAEGSAGDYHLEIQSVFAVDSKPSPAQ